ncbi:WD repeat protein Lub1 [Xanthoria parietina]
MSSPDFKLSASLEEHEDDVRGVAFPHPKLVVSASRDTTVREWKLLEPEPPRYDCSITSHGSAFVNAVAFCPPIKGYPDGLIISGGKDTIIEVREPGREPDKDAEALLLGHAHNVCALDVSQDGTYVVSGSWDSSARVWTVGKWECDALLEGHQGSVWAVLAYDRDTIITGCADQIIRLYTSTGKFLHTIKGSTDVIRALCRVSPKHPSEADFASAGNDGIIRLWRLNGKQVGELHGHESFIYSLTSLPTGELVSSGEDRTVRIWSNNDCVQTITHPAISVWGVAACSENGDIVSGASDKKVRVFSRVKERQAAPDVIQAFEDSVKGSSIPKQQVGDVQKDKLPGPEFLQQKSGTKEGQVIMIKEDDGSVGAYQWSQGNQSWMSVGTVVDAVGSSGKKTDYLGKDYDYVFDVDIEDGKPPLKLPYNLSQNPYEAATKFIQDNELPMTYLDQVANFITSNTQGATLGQASQAPAGSDPYGTESRYRPGESTSSAPTPSLPTSRPKVLPQTSYLSIKTANLRTIRKKIEELNQQLTNEGYRDAVLNESQLAALEAMIKPLEQRLAGTLSGDDTLQSGVDLVMQMVAAWPAGQQLPALDLLRLLTAATPAAAAYRSSEGGTLVDVLESSKVFEDPDRPNNIMLAVRAFSNLFEISDGRTLAEESFDKIHTMVKSAATSPNRNLKIAITTLYVNYAVLYTSSPYASEPRSTDRALTLLDDLSSSLIRSTVDSEAVYRGLVAAGTLLGVGEELPMAAKEIYDLDGALKKAEQAVKEPRIKGVVGEIRALLLDS